MTIDLETRRMSLDGIFLLLRLPTFPSPPVQFTAYAALFNGRGEGEMVLTCTRLETEADVYYHKRWMGIPGGGKTIHCELRVRRLRFPKPGRYSLTLSFNGTPLTVRYLDILRA